MRSLSGRHPMVVVLLVAVIASLVTTILITQPKWWQDLWKGDPVAVAEQELEKLARDYYENYYYKTLENPATTLAEFAETGLPSVKLRTLLAFDDGKYEELRELFSRTEWTCDTNLTAVKVFPYEPYGETDYRIELKPSCEAV